MTAGRFVAIGDSFSEGMSDPDPARPGTYIGWADRLAGVLAAGCDLALHCSGDFAENALLCENAPQMTAQALARLERAMAWAQAEGETDVAALVARRDALLVSAA